MGRKKTMKARVYTFGQCDTLMHRYAATKQAHPYKRLRGNVFLCHQWNHNYFAIRYLGERLRVTLARIYRASEGDTLYEVYGVGHAAAADRALPKDRDKRTKVLALWRKAWKQYAPMFTPVAHDEKLGAITACYRVQGGFVLPCGPPAVPGRPATDPQGVWLARPMCYHPKRAVWEADFARRLIGTMEKGGFARLGWRFFNRLKKEIGNENMGVVQLVLDHECDALGSRWKQPGLCFGVCTPPSRSRNGRRLVVKMAAYDTPSDRQFHHADGDFALTNAQFYALEDGAKRSEMLRWRCVKDAINGIKEWVIGDIYIPGPG